MLCSFLYIRPFALVRMCRQCHWCGRQFETGLWLWCYFT